MSGMRRVSVSAVVAASPARVYAILIDYREERAAINVDAITIPAAKQRSQSSEAVSGSTSNQRSAVAT